MGVSIEYSHNVFFLPPTIEDGGLLLWMWMCR